MIEIIAAVSRNMVIGQSNTIPWSLPTDLEHFRKLTEGHIVVMGKRTFLSLPGGGKPLKNRTNIVITSTPDIFKTIDGCTFQTLDTFKQSMVDLVATGKKIFIIGGEMLYSHFIDKCTTLHLTYVDKIINDCGNTSTTKFPIFLGFNLVAFSDQMTDAISKLQYRFLTYQTLQTRVDHDAIYLSFLSNILETGRKKDDRTGTGTISTFGNQLRFDISNTVPVLTTKCLAWKACIKELLWFLQGKTDSKLLEQQGVNIWQGNTSRDFLDNRGLNHLPEGDIGCGYGFQWRHFGATYKTCKDDYTGQGYDQLMYVINELRHNPHSRRIFMSAWNPLHMETMALPPCHVSVQFYVEEIDDEKHISCHMYQRSVDTFLGLPFNIFSYTVLTYILAKMTDMKPRELIISMGDSHIYKDHIVQVKEQISRGSITPPKLFVHDSVKYKQIEDITIQDFDLVGYFHHNTLKAKMSV